jgi:ribonucleoside-diphosphate reductase alpha chain
MTARHVLPDRRLGHTINLEYGGQRAVFSVTVGYFPDTGEPAEVFISGAKAGSDVEGIARDSAVLLSLALQYNVPLTTIAHAITREQNGKPQTIIGKVVDLLQEPKP